MEKNYILAIDQGTTSTRTVIFNKNGNIISQDSRRHEQIYPQPGYVSHNAKEIMFNVLETMKKAISLAGIRAEDISGIGITNQRETVVLWDKITGEPICDAIVWQCRRSADICRRIITDGMEQTVREKTGLLPDPYFSASKIKWILENIPQAKVLLSENRLMAGTIDTFIVWSLTHGESHITDYTNASRTMLFNINTLDWDSDLLRYFNVPREILPEVVPSSGICAYVSKDIFGVSIPISGIAGDQHAALFGQLCFNEGDIKNTYGTGCFILQNTGQTLISPRKGLLSTIAFYINGKAYYALEGSVFCAGAAIEWLIDRLGIVSNVSEIEYILSRTEDSGGVYFVPSFSGLSAPHWDASARGTVFGMSLGTNKNHIVRAVCESIAYQSKDVLEYMSFAAGQPIKALKADGGICNNDYIMQFQADILGIPVIKSDVTETTALGAAYLAGLGTKIYKSFDEIKALEQTHKSFSPRMIEDEMEKRYSYWLKAVESSKVWLME